MYVSERRRRKKKHSKIEYCLSRRDRREGYSIGIFYTTKHVRSAGNGAGIVSFVIAWKGRWKVKDASRRRMGVRRVYGFMDMYCTFFWSSRVVGGCIGIERVIGADSIDILRQLCLLNTLWSA
jgi:hypothetical protein